MKLHRRAIAAFAVAAGLTGAVGVPAAFAYQIPTPAQFQSGNWDLDLRPVAQVQVSAFSDPNFGSDFAVIAASPRGQVVYDINTDTDGTVTRFLNVGGTCYLGCRTGNAGGVGS